MIRAMPDNDSQSGDGDSRRGLWLAVRKFFDANAGERSLREQLEDVIDEHEDGAPASASGETSGDLSPLERQMLRNLLHFSEHDADDVAVPRGKIIAVADTLPWAELVNIFAESGHSRLPVYHDTLDQIVGMMHLKDVFPLIARDEVPDDWTALMRQPIFVPQARGALDVLADMRLNRVHLAVVVDEYSGTDGIITIEDLVEEIVGEIEDEHDDAPEQLIVPVGAKMWDCDARAELDDIAREIDPRLAQIEEPVDTLGGLTFLLAEGVPPVGTMLAHESGWRIEVLEADDTHVRRLRLHAPAEERPEDREE